MEEKVVVITGASSGIGRATAELLSEEGVNLVLAARNRKALDDVARVCRAAGAQVIIVVTDVSSMEQVQRLADVTAKKFGAIDVWINNAGVSALGEFTSIPPDSFRRVMETNFFGTVHGCRAALPYLKIQGRGTIINVSSVFGVVSSPYESPYVASKFAIRGFSGSLRQELLEEGLQDIHVCTLMPSAIDTPVYRNAANYTGTSLVPPPPLYDVQQVAAAITSLILHPQAELIVGGSGLGLTLARGHMPTGLFERLFAKYISRKHFTDEPAAITNGNLNDPSAYTDRSGNWPRSIGSGRRKVYAAAGIGLVLLVSRIFSADDEDEED